MRWRTVPVLHVPTTAGNPSTGTICWAVSSLDGPRSYRWSATGHPNRDDAFIGLCDHLGYMKLRLHPSKWRVTYIKQAARRLQRVVPRWKHPSELAPGCGVGVLITVATSNLGPGYPEKRRVRGWRGGRVLPSPSPRLGCNQSSWI